MKHKLRLSISTALAVVSLQCYALNPVVQTIYTADPAPMVYSNTVYLYTGHDEDKSTWFVMKDWRCFSSTDMVNWTDHGSPLSLKDFNWVKSDAWAGQCIERNGKFYYYVPMTQKRGGMAIGVAVAGSPTGPFHDALGHRLVTTGWGDIDPTVFIDDDGQAYLYWGNPNLYYVKLNQDMISFDTSIGNKGVVKVPLTVEGFGKRNGDTNRATLYEEGPWFYKRNGLYYMVYAASGIPENICYTTSANATGPWTFKGVIMPTQGRSFTDHPGVLDYKGHSYFFYHNGALPGGGGFTRSVCVEEFNYNADGTFPTINMTTNGPAPIGHLNPFSRTEAETIAWESGVKTAQNGDAGVYVTDIHNGACIRVCSVDFGDHGARKFLASVASTNRNNSIELRLDSAAGPLIGSLEVKSTGGLNKWKTQSCRVNGANGVHDLFFVFKGNDSGNLFNFDYWLFEPKKSPRESSVRATTGARNPIIWADVPDPAVIRVGDTYYMSSTTMHLCPGVPVMKSKDLVNWEMVGYACAKLEDNDETTLQNGKNMYGRGSWASSLRQHNRMFYATMSALNTGKTYVFKTPDIESGKWEASSFMPLLYDASLFFDDDGRVYMACGTGDLRLVELNADLSGIKPGGFDQVIAPKASEVAGPNVGMEAEGSHLHKINGKYYLFTVTWPKNGQRTQLVFRADKITGPWEGKVFLRDQGVAEGCLIDTPKKKWYAVLFQDHGAVGRTPFLVPVKWQDGWPVAANDGKVPMTLDISVSNAAVPACVAADEFSETQLKLQWQWNHNPDNRLWSLTQRPGFLRLTTGRVDTDFEQVRNMLTQRTFGPQCSGSVAVDVSHMKDGDIAGLALLQKRFGIVGVKMTGTNKTVVMVSAQSKSPVELASVPLTQNTVYLKADCNFENRADKAWFYYSLDGENWSAIGKPLQMSYTMPHFVGYRFALFNYATKTAGGFTDFDYFRVSDKIANQ